jgi:hypothetical protein
MFCAKKFLSSKFPSMCAASRSWLPCLTGILHSPVPSSILKYTSYLHPPVPSRSTVLISHETATRTIPLRPLLGGCIVSHDTAQGHKPKVHTRISNPSFRREFCVTKTFPGNTQSVTIRPVDSTPPVFLIKYRKQQRPHSSLICTLQLAPAPKHQPCPKAAR